MSGPCVCEGCGGPMGMWPDGLCDACYGAADLWCDRFGALTMVLPFLTWLLRLRAGKCPRCRCRRRVGDIYCYGDYCTCNPRDEEEPTEPVTPPDRRSITKRREVSE